MPFLLIYIVLPLIVLMDTEFQATFLYMYSIYSIRRKFIDIFVAFKNRFFILEICVKL